MNLDVQYEKKYFIAKKKTPEKKTTDGMYSMEKYFVRKNKKDNRWQWYQYITLVRLLFHWKFSLPYLKWLMHLEMIMAVLFSFVATYYSPIIMFSNRDIWCKLCISYEFCELIFVHEHNFHGWRVYTCIIMILVLSWHSCHIHVQLIFWQIDA